MSSTPFTDYLRARDAESAERARAVLSARLRRELRRRGLRLASPRLLGFAARTWDAPEAWEDLVQEVFLFALEERGDSLRAQLAVKDNVEGLVIRNVRNFLHDRQKTHDPVGWRTYELALGAVRDRVEAGELRSSSGSRIANDTVLSSPAEPAPAAPAPWPGAAGDRVAAWAEDLVAPLLTGRQGDRLREDLGRRLVALTQDLHLSWRFKDLLDALKGEMRKHWQALHRPTDETGREDDGDDDRPGTAVTVTRQRTPFLERQAYLALERCIADGVRRSGDDGDRDSLRALWSYLRALAATGEARPPKRRLARTLDVPRGRLDRLLPRLEDIFDRCRDAILGRAPYPDFRLT